MSYGLRLWIKANHVGPIVCSAVGGSVLVRGLVLFFIEDDGGTDIAPLWISIVAGLASVFLFTSETPADSVAARPVAARRAALLGVAVLIAAIVALVCYPGRLTVYGSVAVFRNTVGLVGVGLLSQILLPVSAIWVAPLAAGLASWMFAWPLYPSTALSIWGALRAPGVGHMYGGALDLSVPLCLVLGLAGGVVQLTGFRFRHPSVSRAYRYSAHRRTGSYSQKILVRRGLRGVSLLTPVTVSLAALTVWIVMADLDSWGGSPRRLLAEIVPSTMFLLVPLAVMAGVVTGQGRWRSGTAVWETLSGRSRNRLIGRDVRIALAAVLAGICVPVLGFASVASVDPLMHGVSIGAVAHEFLAGAWRTGGTLAAALLGAGIGAGIGRATARIWVPPLCLVLALVVCVPMPRFDDYSVDRSMASAYGYTECRSIAENSTSVCSTVPDASYLPAAARTVAQIYAEAPRPQVLPRKVRVVGNYSRTLVAPGTGPRPQPAVGLSFDRGLVAPATLDRYQAIEGLANTTAAWCDGTRIDDVRALFSPGPEPTSGTMSTTVRALESCEGR